MKNNRVFKILLIASSLLFSGCKKNDEQTPEPIPEPEDTTSIYVDVKAESFYLEKYYNLTFRYNDSFFEGSAKTFDKDLAALTIGHAFTSASKTTSDKFLYDIGFSDVDDSSYDIPSSIDSIGYTIAKKHINDFTVVSVLFRSLQYGVEWGNNFTIGVDGDHLGFSLRAKEVKTALESYVATNCENENVKLWIGGYSRGGGIANLLASLILRDGTFNISQDNMFVYTFAAPNSVAEENCVAYQNVHNIINSADLVINVPPNSFGLKRCGIDYDIYDKNLATIMHDFDNEIEVPEFVTVTNSETGDMEDDSQLTSFVIAQMTKEIEDKTKSAETRELFVTNYEEAFRNMLIRMFQLRTSTVNELLAKLQSLSTTEMLKLINDNSGGKLKDLLKPYFDQDHILYDEDVLKQDCATIIQAAFSILISPIFIAMNSKYRGDLVRIINMHYSDTYYALFLNYSK